MYKLSILFNNIKINKFFKINQSILTRSLIFRRIHNNNRFLMKIILIKKIILNLESKMSFIFMINKFKNVFLKELDIKILYKEILSLISLILKKVNEVFLKN